MSIRIDPDDLTLAELEVLEESLGGSLAAIMSGGAPSVRAIRAIALIYLRRDNPDVAEEDVAQMKLSDFDLGEADPEG